MVDRSGIDQHIRASHLGVVELNQPILVTTHVVVPAVKTTKTAALDVHIIEIISAAVQRDRLSRIDKKFPVSRRW